MNDLINAATGLEGLRDSYVVGVDTRGHDEVYDLRGGWSEFFPPGY